MVGLLSTLIIFLLAGAVALSLFFLKRKGISSPWFTRGLALFFVAVMLVRYLNNQPPIYYVIGLNSIWSPFNLPVAHPLLTAAVIVLVWCTYAAMLLIVTNEFYNYRTLKNLTVCFGLPVFLISAVFFRTYAIASLGESLYAFTTARLWMLIVEAAIGIALPLFHVLDGLFVRSEENPLTLGDRIYVPRNRREVGGFFAGLFCMLLAVMPPFIPQAFIGHISLNEYKLYGFTEEHRVMIYIAILLPVVVYHLLKNKPKDHQHVIFAIGSLAFLWSYIGRWNWIDLRFEPSGWPLQLCNTAMFLLPLCIMFNMERLFNFSLFINVVGAMFAMAMPNEYTKISAIEAERVSFWLNHWVAFGLPLVLVALKQFKRPKFKEWVYSLIAFAVYFVAMLFINAYFTEKFLEECDFFFINGDFIVSNLGAWAERTRDITAVINFDGYTLKFYPLYQTLFFSCYVALTVAIWFVYELLFASWDAAEDRRLRERDYKRMKKELKEYLGDKTIHETISGDYSPRFSIKNFCKRYGSNKHYSVKDVSFDVHGGEIFGFLGPNGAGKSTIIKSMVGIQTITSGNIEICGYDVEKQPVQAKLNTGFVPDHYALYENLTGREYINYIADLFQVDQKYRDEMIEKYVERFQLTGSFDNQMKTYSHGMKQKITIMSALVHDPKVWILDEPLTGLDPNSIHEVKECMKEHAASGKIVFFSSHIIDVVEKICDRIAIIKKGRLRACISIKELNEKGIELEQFYLSIINAPEDEEPVLGEDVSATDKEAATV